MYYKHEHFIQVKDVYNLTLICSEYVVSNTACFCINDYFLGHISILYKITKQLGRIPGKNTLFFDKWKSDIPKFFLNYKESGYWVVHNKLPKSFLKGYLLIDVPQIFQFCIKLPMNSDDFLVSICCSLIKRNQIFPISFLNHKQRGYWLLYNQMTSASQKAI